MTGRCNAMHHLHQNAPFPALFAMVHRLITPFDPFDSRPGRAVQGRPFNKLRTGAHDVNCIFTFAAA